MKSEGINLDKNHGFIVVDNVYIWWDEDHDERVIPVTRALQAALDYNGFPNVLIAVQEHEGTFMVRLAPFCSDWTNLRELIEKLVGELVSTITHDFWPVTFEE